jgi:hypothetical protein
MEHVDVAHDKSTTKGSRFPRRALVTTAIAAGLGGAVVAAPRIVPAVEQRMEQAALGELEGVSLDAALEAAEITRAAVQVIVVPVANLMALLGRGALGLVLDTLQLAHNALAFVHVSTTVIDQLQAVVASWQSGLTSLPIALQLYATADITSAETYLRALKKMVKPS